MTDFVGTHSGADFNAAISKALLLPSSLLGGGSKILALKADLSGFELVVAPSFFPVGTSMVFDQAIAPTGWTKKSDWADNASLIIGNAYGSGGADSPTSWVTAVGVGPHDSHEHIGPSHVHAGSSHAHVTSIPRAGWGQTAIAATGYLVASLTGTLATVTGAVSRALTSEVGGTENTGYSGTENTGSGGPTTHAVTQATYTPKYQIVIAAIKN